MSADPDSRADPDSQPESGPRAEPDHVSDTPERWPVDPGLTGDSRGSMRVRAATPAADRDPRGSRAASTPETGFGPDPAVTGTGAGGAIPLPQPKPGDPEAWTPSPSPEPWSAPEPQAEPPKVAEPAEPAEADGRALPSSGSSSGPSSGPATGPTWFARGTASPAARHFFALGDPDPGPWPPPDPEARDSEESPA